MDHLLIIDHKMKLRFCNTADHDPFVIFDPKFNILKFLLFNPGKRVGMLSI